MAEEVTFVVDWDQSAANWDGPSAPDMEYDLDADTNMYAGHPNHTNQEE